MTISYYLTYVERKSDPSRRIMVCRSKEIELYSKSMSQESGRISKQGNSRNEQRLDQTK